MKRVTVFLLVVLSALMMGNLTNCGMETVANTRDLPTLDNDLANGQLTLTHPMPGESFEFITMYRTDYNTRQWRVTDTKNLIMSARINVRPGGEGVTVLVEHVHIDISIKATRAIMDGIKQDSMDDSVHGGDQPGFWVTSDYPYENVFVIEGYSETLIRGWGYYNTSYGYSSLEQTRLTEGNLRHHGGVYGEKVQVVYDLLIRYAGQDHYHTRSVYDEFLIPVGGSAADVVPAAS